MKMIEKCVNSLRLVVTVCRYCACI